MKRLRLSKLASLLAVAMLMSFILPIAAAAAPVIYFGNASGVEHTSENKAISYSRNGQVQGYLLSSEALHDSVTNHVYVSASLDPEASEIFNSVVKAVYADTVTVGQDVYYRYYFGGPGNRFTVTNATYRTIYMSYLYDDGIDQALVVSDAVYRDRPIDRRAPIGFIPGVPGAPSACTVDLGSRGELTGSFNSACGSGIYEIITKGDHVILSANALAQLLEENPDAKIVIATANGQYILPLSVFDFEALAEEVNTSLANLKIRVEIKKVSDSDADSIANQAQSLGLEVVADAVEFGIHAVGPDNSVEITSFGNTYVERVLQLNRSVDPNTATAVVYNPETGSFSFVPSLFWENDGDAYVTLKRNSNSIYTVIAQDKTFRDVPAGHWAEEDIHTLANKLVVHGVSEDQFDLSRNVTRAEFAGLVVRSLGLGGSEGAHSFSDVPENAWYSNEVGIATQAGLIYGYEDGTFRPNEVITREELASLVVRALEYAGSVEELSASEQSALLAPFADADQVAGWASEEMARAIKEQIVFGMGDDSLNPKGNATRAEAVAMLYRYLQAADFID